GARSSYRSHRLRPVCPVPQSNLVLAFALPFFGVPRKLGLMNKRILLLTTLLLGSGGLAPLAAEVSSNAPAKSASSSEKEPAKQTGKDSPKEKSKEPEEKKVESEHAVKIGGQEIKYKATVGTILLRDEDDKPTASIFYIAYTREGVTTSSRPVTFSFNGGPGS